MIDVIKLNDEKKISLDDFKNLKRDFARKNKLSSLPSNTKLLRSYHQLLQDKKISKNIEIENLFKKRSVRSESGIVAVQVLTKPYPCPWQCIFCPDEIGMPKSYISTEPGAMRAALNQFDPIKQVYNRLLSLTMTGHQTDKIEMIVLWWTWDYYPRDYKIDFIKKLYDACNTFSQLEIEIPADDDWNHPKPLFEKEGLNTNTSRMLKSLSVDGLEKENSYKYLSIRGEVWFFDFYWNESYIREQKFITNWTLPYHKDAKEKARLLRKNQTKSEEKIRKNFFKELDVNVYRQKPIDYFIADFYIPSSKLIIEIDWLVHSKSDNMKYDARRDEILSTYWIVVARVKNKDIESNFEQLKIELLDLIKHTQLLKINLDNSHTPSLSKRGQGGDLSISKVSVINNSDFPSLSKREVILEHQKEIKTKRYWYDIVNLDDIRYSDSIESAIKINEIAKNRIIGLTVETRPEYIIDDNCKLWRQLWVTRLEIGVQTMYDDILEANKRWHTVQQIRDGIHKLRQYGFKFSIHIMPGLYKSDYQKDLWTFQKIYSDPYIKPDEIKFYPTSVIPNTKLYDLYVSGDYKALTTEHIQNLIRETFSDIIPPYTRIKRLIRDIPTTEIAAGSNITNLAQLTHNELQKELKNNPSKAKKLYSRLYWSYQLFNTIEQFLSSADRLDQLESEIDTYIIGQKPDLETYRNFVSLDTRSREIRQKSLFTKKNNKLLADDSVNLVLRKYQSSVWIEYFISFEDLQWYLYGFTRLLLPQKDKTVSWDGLWADTALIRELHIYWQLASLYSNTDSKHKKQHKWFGTQLMNLAEELSKKLWYKKLSVISGVWVRWFYKKIWYSLEWTYMLKSF